MTLISAKITKKMVVPSETYFDVEKYKGETIEKRSIFRWNFDIFS